MGAEVSWSRSWNDSLDDDLMRRNEALLGLPRLASLPGVNTATGMRPAPAPAREAGEQRAPLAPTVALTGALGIGCFVVVLALGNLLYNPPQQSPPLSLGENQRLETLLYLGTFGLLLPLCLLAGPRIADAVARRAPQLLSPLAGALVATLALAAVTGRVLAESRPGPLLAVFGLWTLVAAGALALTLGPGRRAAPARWLAPGAWALAGVLVVAALVCFADPGSFDGLGVLVVPAVAVAWAAQRRWDWASQHPARRFGPALDVLVVLVIGLAAVDLVVFRPVGSPGEYTGPFEQGVIGWHHDFVLGPANRVLHGGALLVDTASQYGIGSIYLMAAWFQLAPLGYGAFALLDGLLFGAFFAAGYGVARMAGVSRPLAIGALAVAVLVLLWNLEWSVGSLPAQHGPLRFGLPMLVVAAFVAAERWPGRGRVLVLLEVAAVGLSSVWSLEAFAYTGVTFAGLAGLSAWLRPVGRRSRPLVLHLGAAALACAAAHLVLIGLTAAFRGELPDYGRYLDFLRAFSTGSVGNITYDFTAWSPGIALGMAPALLLCAVVLLVIRRREVAQRERCAVVALGGLSVYGAVLFSYLVNRSADHIVPYMAFPSLLAGTVWLSLTLRGGLRASTAQRRGAATFAVGLVVLVVGVAWSSLDERFERSALGHLVPGGESLRTGARALWTNPPLDPRAEGGRQLVESAFPGEGPFLSLVTPDLEQEVLMRSGRVNRLPFTYPTEDSFVPAQLLPELRRAVAGLRPGERILMQAGTVARGPEVRRTSHAQIAVPPLTAGTQPLAPLQEQVLRDLVRRFRLRVVERLSGSDFVVVRLEPLG